jgi:hypothetical protein
LLTSALAALGADTMPRLAGIVTVGPTCGGPQREGQQCSQPLVGVEVRLTDARNRIVASAVTDAAGRFVLSAPAGHFKLGAGKGKLPACPVLDVELPLRPDRSMHLVCDSGMR